MSGTSLGVVFRILNRQITEHLSWADLLSLSQAFPTLRYVIIHCCAPFENDTVRMGVEYRSDEDDPPKHYTRVLKQLKELPVAARLEVYNVPSRAIGRIVKAIKRCGHVNHISYHGDGFADLIGRLSSSAVGRITRLKLDHVTELPDGSRLTSLTRLELYYCPSVKTNFLASLPCPEKLQIFQHNSRDVNEVFSLMPSLENIEIYYLAADYPSEDLARGVSKTSDDVELTRNPTAFVRPPDWLGSRRKSKAHPSRRPPRPFLQQNNYIKSK